MIHTRHLLAQPTTEGVSDVLKTQLRLVEEMLFRTIELSVLIDSGQHRFIGPALDDLERAERELGRTEMIRAAMTESIVGSIPGVEPSLSDLLKSVDDETSVALSRTAERIRSTLDEIETVRARASSVTSQRVSGARRAITTASSGTGLYTGR